MSWFDKLVAIISPTHALKREYARYQLRTLFDGAGKQGRHRNWNAARNTPVAESDEREDLAARARDLTRNVGPARRARNLSAAYSIGSGMRVTVYNSSGQKDPRLQAIWDTWAKSILVDKRKRQNFNGLQLLAFKTMYTSGEALILRSIDTSNAPGGVPLRLTVLDGDYLDVLRDNSSNILQGIEYNGSEPIAYYILDDVNQKLSSFTKGNSKRVIYDDCIHIFEEERAGQIRGNSWLKTALTDIKTMNEYRDAELMRRKVSACFSAFVTTSPDFKMTDDQITTFEKLEPGAIQFLGSGQDIKFPTLPQQNDYDQFTRHEGMNLSTATDVPYEMLMSNLRDVNFSSARIGQIPYKKLVQQWQEMIWIPHFMDRVWEWFKEVAVLSGQTGFRDATMKVTTPAIEMLDVEKETDAAVTKVRAGLSSLSSCIRSMGGDPDDVYNEIEADNVKLQSKNIVLDSNPAQTTKQGIKQSEETNSANT